MFIRVENSLSSVGMIVRDGEAGVLPKGWNQAGLLQA